jgi:hemoglobin/transferrin/lactoferrin receptor protein
VRQELPESEHWKQPGKQKNSGWAPAFGATAWITDDDRVYARYTETLRLPTIFENTSGAGGAIRVAIRRI